MLYLYFKRMLDLMFTICLLPPVVLVSLPIAALIKIEDGGPIFYCSGRLGKDGHIFRMFKFRSMTENAPDLRNSDGSTFNSVTDSRLTKVGKMLRKTSLDELPQLINVLKGEMSLIGPRPDLPEHLHVYSQQQRQKLQALPGITGYNQAYFRNSVEWFDRIENDLFYIRHISLWLDVKIFCKTILIILKKEGIFVNGRAEDHPQATDL